jgi:hypothetical protein
MAVKCNLNSVNKQIQRFKYKSKFELQLEKRTAKLDSCLFFFLIRIVGGGVHIGCPRSTAAMYWLIVPAPGDCEDGEVGGMKCGWQGKPKYSEKTCPGAILSTTNPT